MNEFSHHILTRHPYGQMSSYVIEEETEAQRKSQCALPYLASKYGSWNSNPGHLLTLVPSFQISLLCGCRLITGETSARLYRSWKFPVPCQAGLQFHFMPGGVAREFLMVTVQGQHPRA